jgi:AraC family transcriptional regulator
MPYLGRNLRSCQSEQLYLTELQYGPQFKSMPHFHEHAFCYLVLEGACAQTYGDRTRKCHSSSMAFHPAGSTHSDYWPGNGGRKFIIEFSARWMDRIRECSINLDRPVEFRGGMPVWLAAHLYRELRVPDDLSPLAIEGLALELSAQFARQSTPKQAGRRLPWLDRVVDLIKSRFREPLTLEELSLEAGVHRVHLVTAFRQHLRCTPFEFLRRCRVEFAAARLINSKASPLEIGLDAGFTDQSHFCKVFKAVTGLTPTEYQRLFSRRP